MNGARHLTVSKCRVAFSNAVGHEVRLMVSERRDAALLNFLHVLHRAGRFHGVQAFHREHARLLPSARTIERWQEQLGDDLAFYPAAHLAALGLEQWHLFLDRPAEAVVAWPYGVVARWLSTGPGSHVLYVRSVVPREHARQVRRLLDWCRKKGWWRSHQVVVSLDGWQHLDVLGTSSCTFASVPAGVFEPDGEDASGLLRRFPFLVPVIFESFERRRSLDQVWQAVQSHLGDARAYLPRGTRLLRRNGKRHVAAALAYLCASGLFRQNVIRYAPLLEENVEVFLVTPASPARLAAEVGGSAVALEVYPGEATTLARITGGLPVLRTLMGHATAAEWLFADMTRTTPPVRFWYEVLFNPKSGEWEFPEETLKARMREVKP